MTNTSKAKSFIETFAEIQGSMHAPKNKTNKFGGYNYRTAEGIIAAFKSLEVPGVVLTCSDELQEVGGHIFVTATARVDFATGESMQCTGHAMHPLEKKGMDASQITGTASSYARKYALNGLFAIEDETADPDAADNRKEIAYITEPQRLQIQALVDKKGADLPALLKWAKADSLAKIPAAMFGQIVDALNKKPDAEQQGVTHD